MKVREALVSRRLTGRRVEGWIEGYPVTLCEVLCGICGVVTGSKFGKIPSAAQSAGSGGGGFHRSIDFASTTVMG